MNDRDFKTMIDRTLADHRLVEPKPTKSWHVRNPDRRVYWFDIVWTPGILSISGDMQSLTLTHFQAMPTWVEAVAWIKNSDIDYLLGKSNAQEEINHERTLQNLVSIANEDQQYDEEAPIWKRIFDYMINFNSVLDQYHIMNDDERSLIERGVIKKRPNTLNHRNKAHQQIVQKMIRDNLEGTLDDGTCWHLAEFTASRTWTSQSIWQIKAIKRWADLVSESEEYQYESALAAQKTA